jgi:hypothetical protein
MQPSVEDLFDAVPSSDVEVAGFAAALAPTPGLTAKSIQLRRQHAFRTWASYAPTAVLVAFGTMLGSDERTLA